MILPEHGFEVPGRVAVGRMVVALVVTAVMAGLAGACVAAPKSTVKISGAYTVQAISSERK